MNFAPIEWFDAATGVAQQWVYQNLVQPVFFAAGWMRFEDEAFDATELLVLGVVEVVVLAIVLGWLERRFPLEPMLDRQARRVDILYTLLHRLGLFPLFAFMLLTPVVDTFEGWLRLHGVPKFNLDQVLPGFSDRPLASFLIYLVVLDFVDYWIHRGQHRISLWWELHALHHSQRQMTFWSDQRNHLLDDLLRDALLALVAIAIGVAPGQFVALTILSRVLQSVQHANLRWRFGPFEAWLVSPSFHRRHHSIGDGHEGPARGCNFAVLFPVWDKLFGTADFRPGFVPTGIRDQLSGRDYGRGFWSQHWLALRRIVEPAHANASVAPTAPAREMR